MGETKAGKLPVYDMADKGVNTTKSPIHLTDGELLKAQNWQTDPALADGAIRRRDGMAKLNSSAMAGSVKGLIALPYPDQMTVTRTFYAAIDDVTTNTWRISTTGAAVSWSTITNATLNKAQTGKHSAGAATIFEGPLRALVTWASVGHKIYFPGDDYNSPEEGGTDTAPTIYSWDGTTAVKLATVPSEPNTLPASATGIVSIVPYSATELLVGVSSKNSTTQIRYGSLLLYDLLTGTMTQLGPATTLSRLVIYAPYVFQGRIWVAGAYQGTTGTANNIVYCRPGDSDWTVDAAFSGIDVGGTTMVEFLGDLYLGTHSTLAIVAHIRKRTTATGAWSTVVSTDGSGTGQCIGPLIVTADKLTCLAFYAPGNGTLPNRILSTTDGASWITDLDLDADLGGGHTVAGIPVLDSDNSIYWAFRKPDNTGFIKKRTSAGSWSTVDTIANLRGPIQLLKV